MRDAFKYVPQPASPATAKASVGEVTTTINRLGAVFRELDTQRRTYGARSIEESTMDGYHDFLDGRLRGPRSALASRMPSDAALERAGYSASQIETMKHRVALFDSRSSPHYAIGAGLAAVDSAMRYTAAASMVSALEGPIVFAASTRFESEIVREVRGVSLAKLRELHAAGGGELTIAGRTVVVARGVPVSGMTLFGENGFILGDQAFASNEELTKSLLHEMYRLSTSEGAAGVSGAMAARETNAAAAFADRAWESFFK